MNRHRSIPAAVLVTTIVFAIYLAVQLNGQTTPSGDFRNAAGVEVRDAQGQVVLSGQFQIVRDDDDDDDDVERKATLGPTGIDADAVGEAEVEYSTRAAAIQEVEFSVRNVAPGATLTFAIDGMDVATATANARGRAEVELDVRIPGATSAR